MRSLHSVRTRTIPIPVDFRNYYAHSFLLVVSPAFDSSLSPMHRSVLCQRCEWTSLQSFRDLSFCGCNSLLFGPLPQFLAILAYLSSSLSPQLSKTPGLWLGSFSLHSSLQTSSPQLPRALKGSLHSPPLRITVLHCLLSIVWKTVFIYFVWFSSRLRQEGSSYRS